MKQKLLLIAALGFATLSQAQNVGIGTTSPGGKLQINHSATVGSPTLILYDSVTDGNGALIKFNNEGSSNYWTVSGNMHSSSGDQSRFTIKSDEFPTLGDYFNILSKGDVGIGIKDPQNVLHLHRNLENSVYMQFTNGLTGSMNNKSGLSVGINPDGNASVMNYTTGESLSLGTQGLSRFSILPDGEVYVGQFPPVTPPLEQFSVMEGNIRLYNSGKGIMLNAADGPLISRGWDPFTSGTRNGIGRWGLFMEPHRLTLGFPDIVGKGLNIVAYGENSTVSKTVLTALQNGNVGINDPTPQYPLDVNGELNITDALRIAGNAGTAGQVLTSTGNGAPQWAGLAAPNIRFSVFYEEDVDGSAIEDIDIARTDYNTSTTAVSIASPGITINTPGLYHLEFNINFVASNSPVGYLDLIVSNILPGGQDIYLTNREAITDGYARNFYFPIEVYIGAPVTFTLQAGYGVIGGLVRHLKCSMRGHMISQ
ncbi:MAG: hypothetical protein H3C36_08020 [Chitinophagaceae bacterium]|nr:hypothetical protein [Chitinophagaceae bacterium]MCW5915060.1 hypothetical protein [Chitinophagaceae bacterium]MCZ2396669.1 hypothetical protein [Chitinophagales bacterium]